MSMKKTLSKLITQSIALTLAIPHIVFAQTGAQPAVTPKPVVISTPILLEGYIPADSGPTESAANAQVKKIFFLIDKGVIQKYFSKMPPADQIPAGTIQLTEKLTGKLLLSPGFIDMHNHVDHAVVPLWDAAKGQYSNRFAWRKEADYKLNVRGQAVKIKDDDKAAGRSGITSNGCKVIQYAEMKALLGGVTTIQGIGEAGNNVCAFGNLIRNVENKADFSVGTDTKISFEVVNPTHGQMFRDYVKPIMREKGIGIEEAYAQVPKDVKDKSPFSEFFGKPTLTNLTDDLFGKISAFKKTFDDMVAVNSGGKNRAFITHLAEGKAIDEFTNGEFQMAKDVGIARQGMVLIHGIGLTAEDWKEAKKSEISLVWSPFSNLLLYGETTNVAAAKQAGINISLGSDWSPSGSKTLLDEVKIAKRYLIKKGLDREFTDKDFYEMMTINAAKALKLEDRLGKLAPGYLADIVAVPMTSTKNNPYTAIVNSDSSSIKLVIVGGKMAIANKAWLQSSDVTEPIVAEATGACAQLKGQVVVNLDFSLQATIEALRPLVKILDGHISCADKTYLSKIDQLFAK